MARKLELVCPNCSSRDIVYSCEPKCCFNHVCCDCQTAFEPATKDTGLKRLIAPPDPLPDCSDPTVACCRCESIAVYLDDDGSLVCHDCATVQQLVG